jgi:hypothetical protein
MRNRRMTSVSVIRSDFFLDMPLSAQALYFQLNAEADDDGIVGNPKSVMRLIGANLNDFDILLAKKFLIKFEDGTIAIKHWRVNNTIPKDRYKPTEYQENMSLLYLKDNGIYTLDPSKGTPCLQSVTTGDYKVDTQYKISKEKIIEGKLSKENKREEDNDLDSLDVSTETWEQKRNAIIQARNIIKSKQQQQNDDDKPF